MILERSGTEAISIILMGERIAGNTDLILRSLQSKRLEGWPQRMDSQPSFETRARARSSG
jgi:hypothetical protein